MYAKDKTETKKQMVWLTLAILIPDLGYCGAKFHVSWKTLCWTLTPKVTVSGSGAFGEWLGQEGRAPWISTPQEMPVPLSDMCGHSKESV